MILEFLAIILAITLIYGDTLFKIVSSKVKNTSDMEIGSILLLLLYIFLRVQISMFAAVIQRQETKLLGLQTHMDSLVVENNAMKRRIQYLLENKSRLETVIRQNSLTSARPSLERQQDSSYCAVNRCYNPKEFALFGVGAIIMGCMVGAVAISWLKKLEVNQNRKIFSCDPKNILWKYFMTIGSQVMFIWRGCDTNPR